MNSGDSKYIWQAGDWPTWRVDLAALAEGVLGQDGAVAQKFSAEDLQGLLAPLDP